MVNFLAKATKEFEQNGRSDLFVAMENKIIKTGKPMKIYFFARYAKGASVGRLQSAMLKYGTTEHGYYFARYIDGANIRPFVLKAIKQADVVWIERFIDLAKHKGVYNQIRDLVKDIPKLPKPDALSGKTIDIADVLAAARNEYALYGRSNNFVAYENYAMYSFVNADSNMFAVNIYGADVRAFERAAIFKGDPFALFLIATNVKGSDTQLMLNALEMSKLDYVEVDKENKEIEERRAVIMENLSKYDKFLDVEEYRRWYLMYKRLPSMPEYLANIQNRYIPSVKYILRKQGLLNEN